MVKNKTAARYSSEYNATNAWNLNFSNGNLNNWNNKVSNKNYVRPVSAFRFRNDIFLEREIKKTERAMITTESVRKLERCETEDLEHEICSVNSYLGTMIHYSTYAIRRYVLQRSFIFDYCWVGNHFGKVAIKRKRHVGLHATGVSLSLVSGLPQGSDTPFFLNIRPARRRAKHSNVKSQNRNIRQWENLK